MSQLSEIIHESVSEKDVDSSTTQGVASPFYEVSSLIDPINNILPENPFLKSRC